MLESSKRLINKDKIEKIGGDLISKYQQLERELANIDNRVFDFWRAFEKYVGVIEIDTYINIAFSDKALKETFNYAVFDILRNKYPKKTDRAIKTLCSNLYKNCVDRYYKINRCAELSKARFMIFPYFINALFFDTEDGLLINGAKFIDIYETINTAKQSEKHNKHLEIIEMLNGFIPASIYHDNEILKKFISFKNGKFVINPDMPDNIFLSIC